MAKTLSAKRRTNMHPVMAEGNKLSDEINVETQQAAATSGNYTKTVN